MKKVLLLGAGRSSASLIRYLIENAGTCEWRLTVADVSAEAALKKTGGSPLADVLQFDIQSPESLRPIIAGADIVISLLPPQFHPIVALRCLEEGKHFVTASYVSDELKAFHDEAVAKGLVFLNECGLDPGIDHLSAMKVIDAIKGNGGTITSFESFTGGLIAPGTDPENPWRYKFTWNPRNVVMAGQGTARYLHDGRSKYISYPQLFRRLTHVHVPGYGHYEGYANRDSLKYIETYHLGAIETMLRGTLRHEGFCAAWDILVQLGCCDDSYAMDNVAALTHAMFTDSFLPPLPQCRDVEEKVRTHFALDANSPQIRMLRWSGLFDDTPIGLKQGTPAAILEFILNKKWALKDGDIDQIVMWHRFGYTQEGARKEIQASLVATGSDATFTAMAKTVGLPLGIATRLILAGRIAQRGVIIPTTPDFYEPILRELRAHGIALTETEMR